MTNEKYVSETEILKEISDLCEEYSRHVTSLNAQYKLLKNLRDNLPTKYLGGSQIEDFLKERNEVNTKEITKLKNQFTKISQELKKLKESDNKNELEN